MTTADDDFSYELGLNVDIERLSSRQAYSSSNELRQNLSDQGSLGHRKTRSSRSSFHAEVERGFERLQTQLSREKHRAENAEKRAEVAERRLQELTAHLKVINEERVVALREAGRAKEELKLYRIQLDTAQREIYRAQDVIGIVDKQRLTAERDAAKSRTRARELNERLLMESAKNEAYQLGLQEGLDRGRRLAFGGIPSAWPVGDENGFTGYGDSFPGGNEPLPPQFDELATPSRPDSMVTVNLRSPSMRPAASPASSVPPTGVAEESGMRLPEHLTPVPGLSSLHPSENGRPPSIQDVSHTPRMSNTFIPPDNFIPSLDSDNRIRIPPPHEFHRSATPDRQPALQLPLTSETNQEPIPIPPRSNTQRQRKGSNHARHSSSDSNSSSLSQLDIINNTDFFTSLRTPMTMIPEVNSAHSGSPLPRSQDGESANRSTHHRRSVSDHSNQSPYTPSMRLPPDGQSQRRSFGRPSNAGSWKEQRRDPEISSLATLPDINIQPPSQPGSSVYGESRTDSSPSEANNQAQSYSRALGDPLLTP